MSEKGAGWIQIECERALYVDRGINTILCDRLPSPVTLVLKVSDAEIERLASLSPKDTQP